MGSLENRLERLEREARPQGVTEFPDWPLEDQLEDVAHKFMLRRKAHRPGEAPYTATDRETHLLGLLIASGELGEEGGEYVFPSGLVVALASGEDGSAGLRADAERFVVVEDLPEWARDYWVRLDPEKQPAHDRLLHDGWPAAKKHREWVAYAGSEEQICKRRKEWRQKERDFLERNRASVGVPPLTPEEVVKNGLEGTVAPGNPGRGGGG